jgi:hypothetical protein
MPRNHWCRSSIRRQDSLDQQLASREEKLAADCRNSLEPSNEVECTGEKHRPIRPFNAWIVQSDPVSPIGVIGLVWRVPHNSSNLESISNISSVRKCPFHRGFNPRPRTMICLENVNSIAIQLIKKILRLHFSPHFTDIMKVFNDDQNSSSYLKFTISNDNHGQSVSDWFHLIPSDRNHPDPDESFRFALGSAFSPPFSAVSGPLLFLLHSGTRSVPPSILVYHGTPWKGWNTQRLSPLVLPSGSTRRGIKSGFWGSDDYNSCLWNNSINWQKRNYCMVFDISRIERRIFLLHALETQIIDRIQSLFWAISVWVFKYANSSCSESWTCDSTDKRTHSSCRIGIATDFERILTRITTLTTIKFGWFQLTSAQIVRLSNALKQSQTLHCIAFERIPLFDTSCENVMNCLQPERITSIVLQSCGLTGWSIEIVKSLDLRENLFSAKFLSELWGCSYGSFINLIGFSW